jgi:long-subunit fatty acid transport protein
MRKLLLTTAATCLLAAPLAQAGGLEKSGQPVTLLFEKGDVVQVDLGYGMPDVTGVDSNDTESGDVTEDFLRYGGGIKKDFNATWSAALIVDEPYGADLFYTPESLAFGGTLADIHSVELTGLARYKFNERFSLHGGLRAARFGGDVASVGTAYGPLSGYTFEGEDDWGLGYVVGGAFEIPAKALRVALTYGSAIDFELDSTEVFPPAVGGQVVEGVTDITMPQSVNLDFQTGIAPKTLLFGSARWTNYEGWEVNAPGLLGNFDQRLTDKDYNIWNYKLGLGRQFTEQWSGAVQATYEPSIDKTLGPLNPTDGSFGLGLAGSYTLEGGTKIGGGVEYRWLGDSTIQGPLASAEFTDNHAVGFGLQVTVPF